jgi:hypothetical protein
MQSNYGKRQWIQAEHCVRWIIDSLAEADRVFHVNGWWGPRREFIEKNAVYILGLIKKYNSNQNTNNQITTTE